MVLASWIQESPVGWVSRKSCFLESKSQIGLLGFQRGLEADDVQTLVTNCSLICWPMSQPPWPLLPQRTRPGLESTSSGPTEMQRGGSRRSEDAARLSSVVAPHSPPPRQLSFLHGDPFVLEGSVLSLAHISVSTLGAKQKVGLTALSILIHVCLHLQGSLSSTRFHLSPLVVESRSLARRYRKMLFVLSPTLQLSSPDVMGRTNVLEGSPQKEIQSFPSGLALSAVFPEILFP